MTTADRPTPTQIQDAVLWLSWWHTGGKHHGAVDRSARVRDVLGQRAYDVITATADEWYRHNPPHEPMARRLARLGLSENITVYGAGGGP